MIEAVLAIKFTTLGIAVDVERLRFVSQGANPPGQSPCALFCSFRHREGHRFLPCAEFLGRPNEGQSMPQPVEFENVSPLRRARHAFETTRRDVDPQTWLMVVMKRTDGRSPFLTAAR